MTLDEAQQVAWIVYASVQPAVVELLLLAVNGDRVESFKALRALQWFDPTSEEIPCDHRNAPSMAASSDVEEALHAVRWVLYAHERVDRLAAAKVFAEITSTMGRTTA